MIRLICELVRPYRGTLLVILLAMLVETATSLATPWLLKIILDNVVGKHKMAPWLADLFHPWMDGRHQMHIAAVAAGAYVLIAAWAQSQPMSTTTTPRVLINGWLTTAVAYLSPPAAVVAGLLRHPPDWHHSQHDYNRHPDHSRLRVVFDVEHIGRSVDHRLHAGPDVLVELGLYADCRRGHSFPAAVRFALQDAIAQAAVGVERVRAILDTSTVIPEKSDAIDVPPVCGEIVFEHVAFAYDGKNPVLQDVCSPSNLGN